MGTWIAITLQQETGYEAYVEYLRTLDCCIKPTSFYVFYTYYCAKHSLFCDMKSDESDFIASVLQSAEYKKQKKKRLGEG